MNTCVMHKDGCFNLKCDRINLASVILLVFKAKNINGKKAMTMFAISSDVSYYAVCNNLWEVEYGCHYNSCNVLALGVADIH